MTETLVVNGMEDEELIVKKSDFESLVFTQDREFKSRCVYFLNNVAISSEKHSAETLDEGIAKIKTNPRIHNIILDAKSLPTLLVGNCESLMEICKNKAVMVLLYVDGSISPELKARLELPNLHMVSMPFDKKHFNSVFHTRGGKVVETNAFGAPSISQTVKKIEKKSPPPKNNLTAFETTAHVRDTIAMISIVDKNRSALTQVKKIGQVFNGLIGALAYFTAKLGHAELRELAIVIDDVSRHYENENHESISEDHYQILLNSIKTSFLILKNLRDDLVPEAEQLQMANDLHGKYLADPELKKRQAFQQDEVDQLLGDA